MPDALRDELPLTLLRHKTQSIWVTVHVPADQTPGNYTGILRVRQGTEDLASVPYTLTVHRAIISERIPLAITNHFTFSDALIRRMYGTSRGTAEWWDLISKFARFLSKYHQNSIAADPVSMSSARLDGNELRYDFSNWERFVETFQSAGVDQHIEGSNMLQRERNTGAPIMMRAWFVENVRPVVGLLPYADPRAQQFLNTFLPGLKQVLAKHGWTKKYLQGVLDEPNAAETAAQIRRLLPGVRLIEPVDARQDLGFMKDIDIWIPQLGSFDDHRLAELRQHTEAGGELWFYTALTPTGRYPNRSIDYSLLKVRILHWMNYRYRFRGFLHWSGNFWGPEPLKDTQPVINENRTYLPPGDAYITYPDRLRRSLYSSIRLEQMREGIEDFALLDELGRQASDRAAVLAREAVQSFTDYVRSPTQFRVIHRKLLEAVSRP